MYTKNINIVTLFYFSQTTLWIFFGKRLEGQILHVLSNEKIGAFVLTRALHVVLVLGQKEKAKY